jgi:hypothetical protein
MSASDRRDEGTSERDGRRVRRTRIESQIDRKRGVFMISVAAELAEMHPQTLRSRSGRRRTPACTPTTTSSACGGSRR